VRHATPATLDELEPLLTTLRTLSALKEKNRGTFYRGSKAFLHFHEDASGLFADVRFDGTDFERCRVTTKKEQAVLVRRVNAALTPSDAP